MDLTQNFDPSLLGTDGYSDLSITNGDLELLDGIGAITQAAAQNIRTLQGEVFLDLALGVPYYQSLLGQKGGLTGFEDALQQAILATPGVTALSYWKLTTDTAKRTVSVMFRATTTLGPVSWSGTLSP